MRNQKPPYTSLAMIPRDELEQLASIIHLCSNPTRLRIIDFLGRAGRPQRVTEIVLACEGTQQAVVSQQLKLMREGGILEAERVGSMIFYRIAKPEVLNILKSLHENLSTQFGDKGQTK